MRDVLPEQLEGVMRAHASQVAELLGTMKQSTAAMESYRTELSQARTPSHFTIPHSHPHHTHLAQSAKKLKQADKDRTSLQSQCAAATAKTLELAQQNAVFSKTASQLQGKVAVLEQLCRSLQADNDRLAHAAAPADAHNASADPPLAS